MCSGKYYFAIDVIKLQPISSGIWVFLNTGVMAYYWVALFSVYNDMGAVTSPAAAAGDSKPQMPA